MDITVYKFMLGVSGTIILLLLSGFTYLIAKVMNKVTVNATDINTNTAAIGKNKGKIDLVSQQQKNDVQRIEEVTQLEIQKLAQNVNQLTKSVETFVNLASSSTIDKNRNKE